MARACAITGKKRMTGNKRSHSLRASRRSWKANLQKVTLIVDGKKERVYLSARALRTLKSKQQ